MSSLWRVSSPSPGVVRLHEWPDDDSAVVYNGRSGDTHMVGPLALEVLSALSGSVSSIDQIAEAVLPSLSETPPDNFTARVAAELERLHTLGLVERSTP